MRFLVRFSVRSYTKVTIRKIENSHSEKIPLHCAELPVSFLPWCTKLHALHGCEGISNAFDRDEEMSVSRASLRGLSVPFTSRP